MSGRIVSICIVLLALLGGALVWYQQVYAYYQPVTLGPGDLVQGETTISYTSAAGASVPIAPQAFEGINGTSSPIRFRACMVLDDPAGVLAAAQPAPDAEPLVAPGWFDCFDAAAIGADLESGAALGVLGQKDIADGVDRVLAIYPDGRAFAWHQLNDTFKK